MLGGSKYSSNYIPTIKTLFGTDIIQYLSLGDRTGTIAKDESDNNFDGLHVNTTLGSPGIGDGYKSTEFVAASSSYVDLYSTGLRDAFNKDEGSILIWAKIPQTTWDISATHGIVSLNADGNNYVKIEKTSTDRITLSYKANATANTQILTSVADVGWVHYAITWSLSNDRVNTYRKGLQSGATMTGLGTWNPLKPLYSLNCRIGSIAAGSELYMSGYEAHYILLNREATASEVLAASNPNGAAAFTPYSVTIPQGGGVPAVMITFDDEYRSVYEEAFAYMQTKGVKGTFYVMTDAIGGTNDPPYITAEQLLEMDAAGWSIGNHTTDQTVLSEVSLEVATGKILDAKIALNTLGLTRASMHLAYPGGMYNDTAIQAAKDAGMLTARRVASPVGYPDYNPINNYVILSTLRGGSGESISYALSAVDAAVAAQKTLLFYGHKLMEPADDSTKWEPWRFRAFIDYCLIKKIPFITINDYHTLQSSSLTITCNASS